MKRTYILIVLMLSALCVNAQRLSEKNSFYTIPESPSPKTVTPLNGGTLIAAAEKGDLKEVDNILSRFSFLANAPLTVYPKNQVAQPLMCQLIRQGKKEMVNLFFKHGFYKNHKCPNGTGKTDVMTLLEKKFQSQHVLLLIVQKTISLFDLPLNCTDRP